jgi:hypothetical protein
VSEYFERVKPTYIEQWPAELCRLSVAQVDIPLTLDQALRLGRNLVEFYVTFPEGPADISDIADAIFAGMSKFPNGAVPRLGSRSPKDSFRWMRQGPQCMTAEEALGLLCDCSERISDDLHLAIANNYSPHIFLRQYVTIPKWTEFRCFMRGRKLTGISQYNYFDYHQEIEENKDSIPWVVGQFFEDFFRDACHLDDVVFDVFLKKQQKRHESGMLDTIWECKLLEINPFGEFTDPCLFDWRKPDEFDGSFRSVPKGKGRPKRPSYVGSSLVEDE